MGMPRPQQCGESKPNTHDYPMVASNHATISPAQVESIAGLTAGSIATLVVHPLDIVKTRMQIHRSSVGGSANVSTLAIVRGLIHSPHPIAALYRGLTPNLVGNAASWSSFFFFKIRLERVLAGWKGAGARLSPADYFVASAGAGALTQVLTNPIWVLKTRILSSDRGAQGAYPGMLSGARRLLLAEGVRGFYRGLGVSLLGVSHGAVQFAVYEPAKRMYFSRRGRGGQGAGSSSGKEKMTTESTIGISTLAKLVAGLVTYPQQVLRSRLQTYDADAQFGRGIVNVVRRIWWEEGLRGFYRGITTGVVRVMPATWVTFLVYENVKFYLPRWVDGLGE
ncbi:probable FAD carrier protein FLX1 [Cephalotrichum gorgonifer]|uniref:Probable FAD carrier protein FLX1 n=1 Tax=Cephalotrichum gorgonifer TaxID=2041049 RepID=A0AAE8MU51_9PEZI|nr:probable FAD carrier protein FLX1 [Cephalotrichum gorgonifer]